MTSKYLKVEISAETKQNADEILDTLLSKKLVTGGQFIQAPARFLWKGKITNLDYITITSFTLEKNKDIIIKSVKEVSIEDLPMITFIPFDADEQLFDWIRETVD